MSCVSIALLLGLVSVLNSGLTEEVIENVIQKSGQILSSAGDCLVIPLGIHLDPIQNMW